MGIATSIYANVNRAAKAGSKFVDQSVGSNQWSRGAMIGAAGMAGYGALNGVVSSDSTVFGGAVGGGTFGAAVGAGAAALLHNSSEARSMAKSALRGMRASAVAAQRNARRGGA